ncbi:transposase, partial [Roseisolibacter agri]|uniref:transposase n=1 Tax=Roseisolibacter agri TaxID=2014610 RepID=UPI0024E0EC21
MDGVAPRTRLTPRARSLDPLLRGPPAPRRRGKRGTFQRAQQAVVQRAAQQGLLAGRGPTAAVDASGFEAHHVSAHYGYRYSPRYRAAYAGLHGGRAPKGRHRRATYPKLTVVVHTASHLILGAVPSQGPANDAPAFVPALRQAAALFPRPFAAVVADAAYDSEAHHGCCHRELRVRRTAIRLNRRSHGQCWPRTRYRRAMRRCFPWRLYHRRQQVESVFSRDKRRLGSALTARAATTQAQEQLLRVLTHNLLLLYGRRRIQQSPCHPV